MKKYNVAVVGVGAVGLEMLKVLNNRSFPIEQLRVLARSARDIDVMGSRYSVHQIAPAEFEGIQIALFAGTEGEKGAALTYAPEAIKRGAVVIDNGADFRLKPGVPLVVPEVNPEDVGKHKGLIANPNCSTIQMVMVLAPLHRKARISRIIVCSYQAASGAGSKAAQELRHQSEAILRGEGTVNLEVLPKQAAFNVFPHIGKFEDSDYTTEEWKCIRETHKILHDDSIKITATCVRVPVFTGHGEAVYIETKKKLSPEEARTILRNSAGIKVVDEPDPNAPSDDPKRRTYPIAVDGAGGDYCLVGRIREDPFVKKGLWLWVVADNLRKGAALNAVQIAELLID